MRRGRELTAVHGNPLPHPDDAVAGARSPRAVAIVAPSVAAAFVGYLQRQRVLLKATLTRQLPAAACLTTLVIAS
jgi:hypothetical protein